ncbi:sugar phosphate isomerase/epimerase family protein [Dictyobacter kobayashii]|uniref:Sugar phosphate isomerase n=1 Tax=Dictyobacter kobayashii TaxID=2014872 RepID=A0A402ANH0_9CHLR|nr:sugar phosphate isomerase/epimerase [Dictyobacter kobayashii]GCE20738.1 sugar phosphate isomerase [Dictyobacter kobayashii]
MLKHKLGAQTYIFSKKYQLDKDIDLLLEGLASSGYQFIEGGPEDAAAYALKLRQYNLRACCQHVLTATLLDLPPLIRYIHTLQAHDITVSGPLKWFGRSEQDYREAARVFNQAGKVLREEGIYLHYHNHDFEFAPITGEQTAMDILLESLDFSAVDLCVDLGFVWLAGIDPLAYLQRHEDKVAYIHLRDFAGKTSTELGRGEMPLAALVAQVEAMPAIRYVIVEQDPVVDDPMASMKQSLQYIRSLG